MNPKAFQDYYSEEYSYCYGCGRLNDHGLQIKSHWDGEETVAVYMPLAHHMAIPGYVYGGLIASLIDCHSTGTAAALFDGITTSGLSAPYSIGCVA